MIIDRLRRLLDPARDDPAQDSAPDQEVCDPIPEEHRLTIPLNGPSPSPCVTIQSPFGDNAFITLDTRMSPKARIVIKAQEAAKPRENISLTVGKLAQGKVAIVIAGSNVDLAVGSSPRLFCKFGLGHDAFVRVGDGTTSSGFEISCERGRVTIGRDCQTATGSMIMGAAHHGIVDLSSGKPEIVLQNPDVQVGNHVWLGFRCYVGGRAHIGDGSIVAAQSSVVAPMPANCLIAGNPAKVRRRNVGWSRAPHQIDPGSKKFFAQLKPEEQN